jgi:ribosomal protein S18 acetylase RimI-like enzyme
MDNGGRRLRRSPPVRPATPSELPAVAALLTRAFAEEPFWRWVTRGDQERLQRFATLALHGLAVPHGSVLVAPALTCAALVVEPGVLPQPLPAALPQVAALARCTGARRLPAVLRGMLRLEHLHPPERHLTLLVLGVDPPHHGLGLGGAALHAVAARADARELPLYLETSTPRARALYRRHGYVDREEARMPSGGPPVWTLLRPVGG